MRFRRAARRIATLGVLAAIASAAVMSTGALGAGATPIDDKQKQAAALEADINDNAVKLDALNEQINAAQDKLAAATQTIADAQSRIAAAQAETDRLELLLRERAASVYRSASNPDDGIFGVDVGTVVTRDKYAAAASAHDHQLEQDLAAARADLAVEKRAAQHDQQAAAAEQAQLNASKTEFETAQAQRQALLGQVQGEIATLVAQAAAARLAAQAPKTLTGAAFDPGSLPPVSGRAGVAVEFAKAQLGKPYEYGAAGPDSYDCSGLTMAAWAAAGVSLPHNSESQYYSLPHVPMDQLQPGDIVWNPGHVGIYVGGGAVIHAPHTGDVVRYIGVSYFQAAARPG